MERPTYLILHGYQGSGPGHWQSWLAARLRSGDAKVQFPDLPDPDLPQLHAWLEALQGEMDAFPHAPVVLCHSLACILWLHHAGGGGKPASRVLFAAPPSQSGVPDVLASFFPVPLDRDALAASAPEGVRIVCSDDDPYCPEGAVDLYARPLGVPADVLSGRGHLNPEAGLGPWPAVEEWAREGAVPITA
jgi:predicted alpha/beta hydrolase family esterase